MDNSHDSVDLSHFPMEPYKTKVETRKLNKHWRKKKKSGQWRRHICRWPKGDWEKLERTQLTLFWIQHVLQIGKVISGLSLLLSLATFSHHTRHTRITSNWHYKPVFWMFLSGRSPRVQCLSYVSKEVWDISYQNIRWSTFRIYVSSLNKVSLSPGLRWKTHWNFVTPQVLW